jgi:hypothetical protein
VYCTVHLTVHPVPIPRSEPERNSTNHVLKTSRPLAKDLTDQSDNYGIVGMNPKKKERKKEKKKKSPK